ncbi:hypothetical protein [Brevibacillus brevis]|uniref:Uncharacterized protein n=1 Tax=Brevibacillus brevis TaxID=1393 RepID=A0ABY9T921_BREBE|nr:hypothetical protein [Brevibacillus brevis]WNC16597.1 hypothetical protein RGB73_09850 [Brevibacillus brevis]
MKRISFFITFFSFVLATGALFLLGEWLSIPWLTFRHEFVDSPDGFTITAGSFVPVLIGLAVSFVAETIYVRRYRKKLG